MHSNWVSPNRVKIIWTITPFWGNIRQWKFRQVARWVRGVQGQTGERVQQTPAPSCPCTLPSLCPPALAPSCHSPLCSPVLEHPPTLLPLCHHSDTPLHSPTKHRCVRVGARVWGHKGFEVREVQGQCKLGLCPRDTRSKKLKQLWLM